MTFVLAKKVKSQLLIFSDTRLSEHDVALPLDEGVIKAVFLSPTICLSFSHSSDLAIRDINEFGKTHETRTVANVLQYFRSSSARTGNDYLVMSSETLRVFRISEGTSQPVLAKTGWIGDEAAYDRYVLFEKTRKPPSGPNYSLVLWNIVSEENIAVASENLAYMDGLVASRDIPSVGGFITPVVSDDQGFSFALNAKLFFDEIVSGHFAAAGENLDFRYNTIVPKVRGMNAIGFFFPAGGIAYVYFAPEGELVAHQCEVINSKTTEQLLEACRQKLGIEFDYLEADHGGPDSLPDG